MNILAVCHFGLYSDLTSSFVHNQMKEFAALGHRVRVIIPNGVGKRGRDGRNLDLGLHISTVDGVELCDLRYITLGAYGEKFFNSNSAIAAIGFHRSRILKDFHPDVLHIHTLGFDSEIGAWLKTQCSCPAVVTTHGSDTAVPMANGKASELCKTADKMDRIVAVSEQLRRQVEHCGTKTPVLCIHNGFVPHRFEEAVEKDPYAMIQVGHLIPSKRTEITIRAFARLQEKYPQLTLKIVGTGHLRKDLEDLCRQLKVEDAVTFTGQLPNRDVAAAMHKASYFVMASKPEGFGIVYLEAMAAGCVTVGTQGQGIADVIVDGNNGFLVPADDVDAVAAVIESCLTDPEKRDEIAKNAKTLAAGMTWAENAEKYVELFRKLLAEFRNRKNQTGGTAV